MTIGSHQVTIGKSQTWITPRWIIDALGPFDLDPCAADPRPWACARENYTERGLEQPWRGRIYLNPPFHRYEVGKWIRRLAAHGNGTALLHARTEAEWFEPIWQQASGIVFLADRLYFHYPDGRRAKANSGAPAVLISFGDYDLNRLAQMNTGGILVTSWRPLHAVGAVDEMKHNRVIGKLSAQDAFKRHLEQI
jgi:hypothetical protein